MKDLGWETGDGVLDPEMLALADQVRASARDLVVSKQAVVVFACDRDDYPKLVYFSAVPFRRGEKSPEASQISLSFLRLARGAIDRAIAELAEAER